MDYTQPPYQTMPGGGVPGMPGTPIPGQPTLSTEKPGKRSKKGEPKPPTKKLINRQFVIAAAFAVLAAGGIYAYTNSSAPAGHYVVVAKGPIATNTTIDASMLTAISLPADATQTGAVTATTATDAVDKAVAELKDVRSQFPITANEQIIPDQFGPVVNLDKPLSGDERLVSFSATVGASVAGSIKAGDHVDMYASAGGVAGPIAYNVPVVSVTVSEDRYNAVADAQTGNKNVTASDVLPGDPVPGTYVVRVASEDVAKIVAADSGGKIYLVYRNADANDTPVNPTTAKGAICDLATNNLTACH